MAKFDFIKSKLQDILTNLTFGYIVSNKGVLRYDGENENDLKEGISVSAYDTETETESPAEDGEYQVETEKGNKILVIKSGIIEEIKDVEEPEEQPQENEGDEPSVDPEEPETPAEEPESEEEVVESGGTEVKAEEEVENPTNEGEETDTEAVVKLREEVNELYKIVDELKARIDKLEGKPAAQPAETEFKNMIKKSGISKLDNFINKYCS